MAISNHERVGRALVLLGNGLRPGLEAVWSGAYGTDWIETLNEKLYQVEENPTPDDLTFLLKGMDATWKPLFADRFSDSQRSYVALLRDARHAWDNNERFTSDEAYRILDYSDILLKAFHAQEQLEQVQALKKDLQRQVFEDQARGEHRKHAKEATKGEPAAGLAPWREVVAPHPDVAQGRFAQAEFAADLYQVVEGKAELEYQDPRDFFSRTYITDGIRDLIRIAVRRLSGGGGDPVVELQTSFGGGKTHSLIALYHLASGIPVAELAGVPEVLEGTSLELPSDVKRAVFVGQMVSPSTPQMKPDGTEVNTMWGDIAWQLGGKEGYAIVAEDDKQGTNPGSKLVELFERFGPAVILIDEWVAYARDLPMRADDVKLPAGDFDTQFTFAQVLTEAASGVDNILVLVSIPSSDLEVGGEKGQLALEKLKHVVSRKAAQWRPASTDESFEIVRRRLFEPVSASDAPKRDAVIKAYSNLYLDYPDDFPSEAKEGEYRRRMEAAYPIHPEMFDRLYEDWSTLDRFQRTRGMLRLMATVISDLWARGDSSLLIMPGTLPMDSGTVVSEMTKYLDDRWEPIIRSDVDGPNSLPLRIDQQRPNLGKYSATRRVARTTYVGSAPRQEDRRGVDLKRIVLGCVQPGEKPGVFHDGLRHLAADATYLYNQGAQYWYDTKASLTRTAADRAENYPVHDIDLEIRKRVQSAGKGPFAGLHLFPEGPGDVPDDDDGVRLVILPPTVVHRSSVGGDTDAVSAAAAILEQRQGGPRINRNLLVFLAADENRIPELRSAVANWMAWHSILDEKGADELDLTPNQVKQVETRLHEADDTIRQRINETFQHVLTPSQSPGSAEVVWQTTRAAGGDDLAIKTAKKLESSEDLIRAYGGVRVRMDLDRPEATLWSEDSIGVRKLWGYYSQYLYMPRLADFGVLGAAVSDGVAQINWQQDTFAFAEAYDEEADRFLGLKAGEHVGVGASQTAVIVKPDRAQEQFDAQTGVSGDGRGEGEGPTCGGSVGPGSVPDGPLLPTRFYGRKGLDPVRAIRDFGDLINEVTTHLGGAEGANVTITVEIEAQSDGFDDRTRRVVSENAAQLGFDAHEFEV